METKKLEIDLLKVKKVINSCETISQLQVADNYIVLFFSKWDKILDDTTKIKIIGCFNEKKIRFFM
jgi:hypothetical protein